VVRLAPQAPVSPLPGTSPARHALRSTFPAMGLPPQPGEGNALPVPPQTTPIESIPPGLPEGIGFAMSPQFRPWWTEGVTRSLRAPESSRAVNVESLVIDALHLSPQIRALSRSPLIQETRIIEADSEFDLRTFMESTFDRPSDPVGNDLVTGGPPRFREEYWNYSAGVRRRNTLGGTVEASQEIGYKHNNSQFFSPREQGLSRLVLSFTQPLLRGAGRDYNTARTVLAEIDAAIANDRFSADLQKQLIQVTRAYWQLFFERASLLQKRQLYAAARSILSELEGRQAIDAARSQIMRARSAVAARYSELARAEQSIRNAESRLSALVGYPDFRTTYGLEMIPVDVPSSGQADVSIEDARRTALERRPEMSEALNNVRAASVRVGVSEQDLLPTLDFVAETYVKGLEGRGDIGTALGQQFYVGEPGYSVGLQFELPWGRRGARSAYDRRRLELQEATSQMDAEAVKVLTEVDVAVGEVQTTFREMQGKYHSMLAAGEDVAYMTERWRILPGEDRSATLVLEDLLDAQLRAAIEQNNFVQAQVNHMMALVELKRVMGTLLQYEQIVVQRTCVDGVPDMMISKLPRQ
jgi:outer membrane protein TolC